MQHDDLSNNNLEHIEETNNNNNHSLHKDIIAYDKQQQQQQPVHVDVEFHFGICWALLIFVFNFLIPGTGTFIASCKVKNALLKKQLCQNGLCQLLTFPLVVGWLMALVYSCVIISGSCFKERTEPIYNTDNSNNNNNNSMIDNSQQNPIQVV